MATSNGLFVGETRSLAIGTAAEPEQFLRLWPLPAKDVIEYSTTTSGELTIVDALGKKLYTEPNVHHGGRIDVADWPRGVYFAQLRHKNGYDLRQIVLVR
jgi:hypothetical protein